MKVAVIPIRNELASWLWLRKVAICLESYSNFAICNFIFKWQVKIGMSQDFCPFFDVTGLQLITRYDIHVALRGLSWGCDYSYIKLAFAVAAVFWAYWNYNKLQFTSCENSTVALQLICNVSKNEGEGKDSNSIFCYSVFSRLRNIRKCVLRTPSTLYWYSNAHAHRPLEAVPIPSLLH